MLAIGQTYTLKNDEFTGKEGDTRCTVDNWRFNRHNVWMAYPWSMRYWYTSKHGKQPQYVTLHPPFKTIGEGVYEAGGKCRVTRHRAVATVSVWENGQAVHTWKWDQRMQERFVFRYPFKIGMYVKIENASVPSICISGWTFKKMAYLNDQAPPPNPTPPPEETPVHTMLATGGHGFMSMIKLSNGQILAGKYSGTATSDIYCVGHGKIDNPNTGESAFRFYEDEQTSRVYLAVENRKVYWDRIRTDPKNYHFAVPNRKILASGIHDGAFAVNRVRDKLVMLGGEIYVDGHGTRKMLKNDYYCKAIFEYRGWAFIPGYSFRSQRAGWFQSQSALNWYWKDVGPRYSRFINAVPAPDSRAFWLVGTVNYKGGHNRDSAAIWQYNQKGLQLILRFPGYDYISCVKYGPNDKVYFMLTRTWKGTEPGCALMELSGNIRKIKQFPYSEGREIDFIGNDILCATRTQGRGGKIYKVCNVL